MTLKLRNSDFTELILGEYLLYDAHLNKSNIMAALEFREPSQLFDKIDTGLKVKFDFWFHFNLYKMGDIIPKDLAIVKRHDGTSYSFYDDPESVVYTVRIEDDGQIVLAGFWQKKNE